MDIPEALLHARFQGGNALKWQHFSVTTDPRVTNRQSRFQFAGPICHSSLKQILRESLTVAGAGIAIGLLASLALTRYLETLLFEVKPTDPGIYAGVAALICCSTLDNFRLRILPNDPNFKVTSRVTLNSGVTLLSLTPHMHYRGKPFEYQAVFPNGRTETLLEVP